MTNLLDDGIPAEGTLLTEFLTQTSGWDAAEFAEEFPDPFLIELRASPLGTNTAFETPPSPQTQDEQRGPDPDAIHAGPSSRLLSIRKRRPTFPRKVSIGRTRNNDLVVLDAGISKLHAFFEFRDTGWAVVDAGPKNGTFVDGRRLEPYTAAELVDGAVIQLAGVKLVYLTSAGFRGGIAAVLPAES